MNTRTIDQESAHWYQEPWPWILLGLPGSVVIAGIVTLVIAIKNEDGLVAEDYYKQGLAINQVIARETNAERLGLTAQMLVSGDKLRIVIVDDGLGIDSQVRETLFEPFVSTKPEGIGLGLPTVMQAAERLNGKVEWTRADDMTKFIFTCTFQKLEQ